MSGDGLVGDDRARIPFAVIGVLLLLGSSVYAASVATRGPVVVDRDVDRALDEASTALRPTVRAAASDAFRQAALNPVTVPANTSYGAVLSETTPFRDALRIRVYVAVARALEGRELAREASPDLADRSGTGSGSRSTTVSASVPDVEDPDDLRAAMERVRLQQFEDDRGARVTIRNLTLTVRRRGETVARENRTVTVDVGVPTLTLHERTERFQRRLDRGPVVGPGAGRYATAELTLYAWARGYRQWSGEPIANVVGTRHVAAAVNSAVLREQRLAFGRADPAGERAMAVALAKTVTQDYAATQVPGGAQWTDKLLRATGAGDPAATRRTVLGSAESPNGTLPVGVNGTADEALVALLADGGLGAIARDGYRVEAELRTVVDPRHKVGRPDLDPPGPNWTLADRSAERNVTVVGGDCRAVTFTDCRRVVSVTYRETRRWIRTGSERGDRDVVTRTVTWSEEYGVRVRTNATYAPTRQAPEAPTEPLYRPGGRLDGPNLADVPATVRAELLGSRGGVDAVAKAAVVRGERTRNVTVYGRRPDGLRSAIASDLARLRDRVRNVTVSVSRRAVARGDAVPAARLASALRERRGALVGAPATYDGAAERAIVAARVAYLRALDRALRERAAATRSAQSNRRGGLGSELTRARAAVGLESGVLRRGSRTDGGGVHPRGTPAYLTVTQVTAAQDPSLSPGESYHPLVTRNVNWAAVPYDDAADAVVDAVLDRDAEVGIGTAGRTLAAAAEVSRANGNLTDSSNATLQRERAGLRNRIQHALVAYRTRARQVLARETSLSRAQRRAAVDAAFERWSGTTERARAVTNGSFAAAVADAAVDRGVAAAQRPWLESRLRVVVRERRQSDRGRVTTAAVNRTTSATRRVGEHLLRAGASELGGRATAAVARRVAGRSLSRIPAGIPLVPPYGWYATVNGWSVSVRGEYRQFVVRARYGPPDGAGGVVRYVRDGEPVALDVDDDGDPERLGRSERLRFSFETAVVVAVPPGRAGVGDVDGNVDERSPGWPCPGAASGPNATECPWATDERPDPVEDDDGAGRRGADGSGGADGDDGRAGARTGD